MPRITWATIPRAVQHDGARSLVMGAYYAAGYCPEDLASKRSARVAMVAALSRAEDLLENLGAATRSERADIRGVRRQLEGQCFR